jgi:hypothetical protein
VRGSYTIYYRRENLKTAAFFALIAMLLLTFVDATFLNDLLAFSRDAIAAMTLLSAAIHLLASLAVAVFFFVFYRAGVTISEPELMIYSATLA